MTDVQQRIDWEAAKRELVAAELCLEKGLVATAERVDAAYRHRATQLANRRIKGAASEEEIAVLVFSLGMEIYGLPIADLAEVLPPTKCTPVPKASAEIEGVINLRGEVVSVINLYRVLSLEALDESDSRIVMLKNGGGQVGLKVGMTQKVQSVPHEHVLLAADNHAEGANSYIKGLAPGRVIILDPDAIRRHPVFRASLRESRIHIKP